MLVPIDRFVTGDPHRGEIGENFLLQELATENRWGGGTEFVPECIHDMFGARQAVITRFQIFPCTDVHHDAFIGMEMPPDFRTHGNRLRTGCCRRGEQSC